MGRATQLRAKLVHLVVVLLLVSAGTFLLTEVAPGDPAVAILGPNATPDQYQRIEAELDLDRPVAERYLAWLGDAVRGDFGTTLVPPVQSVTDLVRSRLPVTVELAALSMLVALAVAVPLGTWSAYRAGRRSEAIVTGGTFAVLSVPSFLAALLLVHAFVLHPAGLRAGLAVLGFGVALLLCFGTVRHAVLAHWGACAPALTRAQVLRRLAGAAVLVGGALTVDAWFPVLPRQGFVRLSDPLGVNAHLRSILLPVLALGLTEGAMLLRVLRSDMIAVLNEDYVLAARATGISDARVLVRHALRPASLSLVTMSGVSLGRLLGGTVVMESIFRLPGMGSLMVEAVADKDFRVVQAGVLVISTLYVALNLVVDLGYERLDPRLRRAHH